MPILIDTQDTPSLRVRARIPRDFKNGRGFVRVEKVGTLITYPQASHPSHSSRTTRYAATHAGTSARRAVRRGAWPSAASVVDKALLELNESIAGCAQGGATALSRPTQASSTHRHTHRH